MRDIIQIQDELKDLDALVSQIKEFIKIFPEDHALTATHEQYEYKRSIVLQELNEVVIEDRRHILDISLQLETAPTFTVLKNVLEGFQSAVNAARLMIDSKIENIDLQFASTFHGSFGIKAISTTDDKILLGGVQQTFEKLFEINESIDAIEINSEIVKNKKALRAFAAFYGKISEAKIPVNAEWLSLTKEIKKFTITESDAISKRTKLLQWDTIESVTYDLDGIVKEINLINNTFILVSKRGKKVIKPTISFDSTMKDMIKGSLEKNVSISIEHTKSWDYEENQLIEKKILKKITV